MGCDRRPRLGEREIGSGAGAGWFALTTALLCALGGCAVGPDYVRPALALPDRLTAGSPASADSPASAGLAPSLDIPAEWWRVFHSEPLNALVAASLSHHPTLDAARAALRASQEALLAERAAFLPSATLGVSTSRQSVPDALASPAASGASYYNLTTAQLSVVYAPDVFGGTRRQVESARALAELQRFQFEATALTLTSNVVVAAITEASLQAQRDATISIVASQRAVLESERAQLGLGQVAPSDLTAQEAQLATLQSSLPPLEKQLAQQRVLLTTLVGRYPSDAVDARFDLAEFELPVALPRILPSSLVQRRPDVRAAEAQLQSASAQIGVAVAARLPNFLLGGNSVGVSATSLSQLFSASSMFWTLAAGVSQPLFDAGALAHREEAARATFDQAAALYRATVLGAFQDVANSLEAIDIDARALKSAVEAERAVAANVERTRRQVALGDVSPLALRIAEQGQQQAVLARVQAQAARLADTAALFQSLGGGWWNDDERRTAANLAGATP